MRIDLRVGQIVSAERVPKSKKLLKLEVSLGESLGNRQILAGIGTHYEPDVLVGRRVAIVANLTPAKLMGLESQGMLLAGSSEDDSVLAVLEPDCHLPLGARIR
jgi:methionyl-tRNA synthetase